MSDTPKGATHQTLGTLDRPRSAVNEVGPISYLQVHREELIELEGLDPDSLDPERHYRLVSTRDPRIMRRRVRQQYKPELLGEGVRTIIKPEDSTDGTIRFGDRILMSCPRSTYEARRDAHFRFNESRMQAAENPANALKEKAAGLPNVQVVDHTRETRTIEEERQK